MMNGRPARGVASRSSSDGWTRPAPGLTVTATPSTASSSSPPAAYPTETAPSATAAAPIAPNR